ncbi:MULTISPECIES: hypothetical protein [unclassified Pseudomonas]|uniref:hypothetical protein n=1 Tax=unclassified Pseudomonas TaxID=196821 RepID=UPI000C88DA32|nr:MULTISPECIES: hypothetical protein [unclassified Pseudomonas]PMX14143.1 hypothetical protein C1Y25_16180 [Pseudomonas sp. MPBC4-3]PMX46241.1 hypothetical protein C1Y20_17495 [Pseudomonas sp. FW301-21B01]PMY07046.1 hypothetical protein C1Y18_14305 [Pseudomonas sp. MPR-R5A]PNA67902.1 hypothetical protein C1Y14_15745 [Pseudomonas sp. MPR-R5B]
MDNQKVRSYLRKGELAAALLETLGYSYEENSHAGAKWAEPAKQDPIKALSEKFETEVLKPMIDQLKGLAKAQTASVCPVNIGTRFTITKLPAAHFLNGYSMPRDHVYEVEEVARIKAGTERAQRLKLVGLAISFDVKMGFQERRLWLPLDCIKVVADADF